MRRALYILALLAATTANAQMSAWYGRAAYAATTTSAPTFSPYAEWDWTDLHLGLVTQWISRVGGYSMTNFNRTINAPTNSGNGVEMMIGATGCGMNVSPALPIPTNSAFAFVFLRRESGQRFVGFGNTGTTAFQLPFVYTDSSLYSSPGFATQTKLSSGGFPTNYHLLVVVRNATSVWARIDGAAFGSNGVASAVTTPANVFGLLGPGTIANNATNVFYRIAAYSNEVPFTPDDADSIRATIKSSYPTLP